MFHPCCALFAEFLVKDDERQKCRDHHAKHKVSSQAIAQETEIALLSWCAKQKSSFADANQITLCPIIQPIFGPIVFSSDPFYKISDKFGFGGR
jgi:hypothetical protein